MIIIWLSGRPSGGWLLLSGSRFSKASEILCKFMGTSARHFLCFQSFFGFAWQSQSSQRRRNHDIGTSATLPLSALPLAGELDQPEALIWFHPPVTASGLLHFSKSTLEPMDDEEPKRQISPAPLRVLFDAGNSAHADVGSGR